MCVTLGCLSEPRAPRLYAPSLLLRWDHNQIERSFGLVGNRVVPGDQRLVRWRGDVHEDVGWTTIIGRRKIALKPIRARCVGDDRGAMIGVEGAARPSE